MFGVLQNLASTVERLSETQVALAAQLNAHAPSPSAPNSLHPTSTSEIQLSIPPTNHASTQTETQPQDLPSIIPEAFPPTTNTAFSPLGGLQSGVETAGSSRLQYDTDDEQNTPGVGSTEDFLTISTVEAFEKTCGGLDSLIPRPPASSSNRSAMLARRKCALLWCSAMASQVHIIPSAMFQHYVDLCTYNIMGTTPSRRYCLALTPTQSAYMWRMAGGERPAEPTQA